MHAVDPGGTADCDATRALRYPQDTPKLIFVKRKRVMTLGKVSLRASWKVMASPELSVKILDARAKIESLINENRIRSQMTKELCETHPAAVIKMLDDAIKKLNELEQALEEKDDKINALVAQERETLTRKEREVRKWMDVVQRKNDEKIVVSPTYLGPPD